MERIISIIIPVYNVEEYLTDCLESVKRNVSDLDAEVLLIDDGSTDNSSAMAKLYAEKEKKFCYYRKENGGLSSARNYGVSLAIGKYLYFVDSDDVLADGILPKMLEIAERNGTELTVCHVARLKNKKVSETFMHVRAFNGLRENISHIKKHSNFVYDSTSWNKLILHSFYKCNKILFPEGYLYEDMLPNFKLHYLCNGVSVVRETGYLWRIRTGKNKQITQEMSKKALTDKIEMVRQLLDYIQENVREFEIEEKVVILYLTHGFNGWLNRLRNLPNKEAAEFVRLIREFADHPVIKRNLHKLPLVKQQLYQDIFIGDFAHLLQIVNYMNENYSRVPIFKTEPGRAVKAPDHLLKMKARGAAWEFGNHALPSCFVDMITVDGDKVYLQGHLYVKRISIPYIDKPYVKAFLLNENTSSLHPLLVSAVRTPGITKTQGSILNYDDYTYYQYDYDGSGFKIHIDFAELTHKQDFKGKNYIILSYDFGYCSGNWLLKGIDENIKRIAESFTYDSKICRANVAFDVQNIISIDIVDTYCHRCHIIDNNECLIESSEKTGNGEKPKVSVIIPVYNVERFLAQCLDSVITQTCKEIEIICVEDCSTDRSKEILKNYAARDFRIRVIWHEKNLGLLKTRKDGVVVAKGQYIMFVDSDDTLEPNACETAYAAIEKNRTDAVEFGVHVVEPSGKERQEAYLKIDDDVDRIEDRNLIFLRIKGILKNWQAWNKIYRADLCKKAYSEIDDGYYTFAEDFLFFCVFGYYARSFSWIPEKLYHWRWGYGIYSGIGSEIGLNHFEKCLMEKDALDVVIRFFNTKPDATEYQAWLQKMHDQFLHQTILWWNDKMAETNKKKGLLLFAEKWGQKDTLTALAWLLQRTNLNQLNAKKQLAKTKQHNEKLQTENKNLQTKLKTLLKSKTELDQIKKSRGFKVLKKYYKLRDAIFHKP